MIHSSVRSLVSRAESSLGHGRINHALLLVHDFVERIFTEPICTAQVFSSEDLDQLCLKIGRRSFADLNASQIAACSDLNNRQVVVYLVSRLQRSGGHSRLVQDFILSQPEKTHLILSTEVGGPSDEKYLSERFASVDNVRFMRAPRGDFQTRLNWMQSALLASQPEHVHLFNHHQDSVAVSALVPELELIGSFQHHGDHHLCLGAHMRHLTHVDFHPMGYHYCRHELGVNNVYLPLTFEDKLCTTGHSGFSRGGSLTTATAARSNKVEIPYYVSYIELIPEIIGITGGKHIHIGKLTPWALSRVYKKMRRMGIKKERFVYIEWSPSVWNSLHENMVDVYLASFPYGAALTLVEAMGAGIPVVMHQHMQSRVLSGLEMAYPEAFRWTEPEELLTHLAKLTPETLEHEKKLSRLRYERFHRPVILRNYLRGSNSSQLPVPPLASEFKPRYDEWAAWAESQLNMPRLLYRFAYRAWRKLRRMVS